MTAEEIVCRLSVVGGTVSIKDGIATLESGETIGLRPADFQSIQDKSFSVVYVTDNIGEHDAENFYATCPDYETAVKTRDRLNHDGIHYAIFTSVLVRLS